MKLNVLLAFTDQLRSVYKNMVADHTKFYSTKQGAFKGEKKTYTPKEGVIDVPSMRGITRVITTVDEKLDYFVKESSQFVDALFSQEKTNAMGVAVAKLVVDNKEWGTFTSLELLRLKSLLESSDLGNLEHLISSIPVRSDNEVWNETSNEDYTGRRIYETDMLKGVNKTTVKEEYILEDPNLKNIDSKAYTPRVSVRDEVLELGDYTKQNFSGEWSHAERAAVFKRRSDLLAAITVALKEANECDSIKSDLTANKIFSYLFKGE